MKKLRYVITIFGLLVFAESKGMEPEEFYFEPISPTPPALNLSNRESVNRVYDWAYKTVMNWLAGNEYENINKQSADSFVALFGNPDTPLSLAELNRVGNRPLLAQAVLRNNVTVTKLLLALGADPETDLYPHRLYRIIAESENPKSVALLQAFLNAGLKVNNPTDKFIHGGDTIGQNMIRGIDKKLKAGTNPGLFDEKRKLIQDAMRGPSYFEQAKGYFWYKD